MSVVWYIKLCTCHGSSSMLGWWVGLLWTSQLWTPQEMCSLWRLLVGCSSLELSSGRRRTCTHSVLLVCRLPLFYWRWGVRCWNGLCLLGSAVSCRTWLGLGGIVLWSEGSFLDHTGKCIRRFGGIYVYCRYFIDRKWQILVLILYRKACHLPKGL